MGVWVHHGREGGDEGTTCSTCEKVHVTWDMIVVKERGGGCSSQRERERRLLVPIFVQTPLLQHLRQPPSKHAVSPQSCAVVPTVYSDPCDSEMRSPDDDAPSSDGGGFCVTGRNAPPHPYHHHMPATHWHSHVPSIEVLFVSPSVSMFVSPFLPFVLCQHL